MPLHLADGGQGPGYQQINPKSSQIWRGTSTDTDFLQGQSDEPQPLPDSFHDAHFQGTSYPREVGMLYWEGKEVFPSILFFIFLLLLRFSKSVTLIMPLNPQPDS